MPHCGAVQMTLNLPVLRDTLLKAGLNQAGLAERLKVSREAVSKWLSGESFPQPDKLLRIGVLLRLTFEQLVVKPEPKAIPVVSAGRRKMVSPEALTPRASRTSQCSMRTTVTTKNMVTIPAALSRQLGIAPGCQLDWESVAGSQTEIRVRVVPKRGELARRLMGSARRWSPGRDAVRELIEERAREDQGEKPA